MIFCNPKISGLGRRQENGWDSGSRDCKH